jgi:hypothetical protein
MPGPSGPGSGAVIHVLLRRGWKPPAELSDLPRPADVHRDVPALELLIEIRHLGAADLRREPIAEQSDVEVEGATEARIGEIGVEPVVAEEGRARLQPEYDGRRPLVRRHEDRILARAHP